MKTLAPLFALAALTSCQAQPAIISQPITVSPPAFLVDGPDEVRSGLPVNFTQAKAGSPSLPDPLVTLSGKPVSTPGEWTRTRRPEIMQLFRESQHGVTPIGPITVVNDVWEEAAPALNGAAIRRQAVLRFGSPKGQAVIDIVTYTPAKASGPVPMLINLGFSPNVLMIDDPGVKEIEVWTAERKRIPGRSARAFGKIDVEGMLARGYGVTLVYYGQIEPDFAGSAPLGVRALFGASADDNARKPDEWGSVGAWAWGLSRVLDYLETVPTVDSRRVAIQGVSRLGKTVLWAGASDPRFAMVIASCSGEGGAALASRNYGETVAHVAAAFPYWFAPHYRDFAKAPATSPVDSHMLLSLVAPRPLLLITGETDAWSDPYGEFLAARAASPVYELLGKQGISTSPYPALDQPILNDIGFVTHTGGHGSVPLDAKVVLDFMDKHFAR